jgi:hypothetical protein
MPPKKQTRGTLAATPCPHEDCGKPNDFRGVAPGGGAGPADFGLEPGTVYECDHCGKKFVVARTQRVTMIWLKEV